MDTHIKKPATLNEEELDKVQGAGAAVSFVAAVQKVGVNPTVAASGLPTGKRQHKPLVIITAPN